MSNRYAPVKVLTYLLLFAVILYACKKESDRTRKVPSFYLDSLIVSTNDFRALENKNIIFNYYLSDTAITLNGYALLKGKRTRGKITEDTGSFKPTPDLVLKPVGKTAVAFGPNTFISNQVLLKTQVNDIIREIGNKKGNLLFVPVLDADKRTIRYNITFSGKIDTTTFARPIPTNPCPPCQYFYE